MQQQQPQPPLPPSEGHATAGAGAAANGDSATAHSEIKAEGAAAVQGSSSTVPGSSSSTQQDVQHVGIKTGIAAGTIAVVTGDPATAVSGALVEQLQCRAEQPMTLESAQQRCDLFCALCTKKHSLIPVLLGVYGKVTTSDGHLGLWFRLSEIPVVALANVCISHVWNEKGLSSVIGNP